jgi:hypothetical protein
VLALIHMLCRICTGILFLVGYKLPRLSSQYLKKNKAGKLATAVGPQNVWWGQDDFYPCYFKAFI